MLDQNSNPELVHNISTKTSERRSRFAAKTSELSRRLVAGAMVVLSVLGACSSSGGSVLGVKTTKGDAATETAGDLTNASKSYSDITNTVEVLKALSRNQACGEYVSNANIAIDAINSATVEAQTPQELNTLLELTRATRGTVAPVNADSKCVEAVGLLPTLDSAEYLIKKELEEKINPEESEPVVKKQLRHTEEEVTNYKKNISNQNSLGELISFYLETGSVAAAVEAIRAEYPTYSHQDSAEYICQYVTEFPNNESNLGNLMGFVADVVFNDSGIIPSSKIFFRPSSDDIPDEATIGYMLDEDGSGLSSEQKKAFIKGIMPYIKESLTGLRGRFNSFTRELEEAGCPSDLLAQLDEIAQEKAIFEMNA